MDFSVFYIISGILFIIICITDLIDGWLARKFKWESDFGKLWDPLADKVAINSILVAMSALKIVPVFVPIIMICRDIIVDATRIFAAKSNRIIAANKWGKIKTISQMVAILIVYFLCNTEFYLLTGIELKIQQHWVTHYIVQNMFMYIACIFSIISGLNYYIDAFEIVFKKRVKKYKPEALVEQPIEEVIEEEPITTDINTYPEHTIPQASSVPLLFNDKEEEEEENKTPTIGEPLNY